MRDGVARVKRRAFLEACAGVFLGGELSFVSRLAPVSAEEARLEPERVLFDSAIEPLVRLVEDTLRETLVEEVATRIRGGLTYRGESQ